MKPWIKGLTAVLGICMIALIALYILRNPLATRFLETKGTKANGARVTVNGLDLDLFHTRVSFENLAVADPSSPMTNRVETGRVSFDIELLPLLSRSVVIRDMRITGIRDNTPRTVSGQIPGSGASQGNTAVSGYLANLKKELQDEVAAMPVMAWAKLDSLDDLEQAAERMDITAPAKIRKLTEDIHSRHEMWEKKLDLSDRKAAFRALEKDVKKLGKKVKGAGDIFERITLLESVKERANTLLKGLKTDVAALRADAADIHKRIREVPEWISQDYAAVKENLTGADLSPEGIATALFGRRIGTAAMVVVDQLMTLREEMGKPTVEKTASEQPPWFVWIKQLEVDGKIKERYGFSGSVHHFSTDAEKAGSPMTVALSFSAGARFSGMLRGVIDYRRDQMIEQIEFTADPVDFSGIRLVDSGGILPEALSHGNGRINALLNSEGNQFMLAVRGAVDDVALNPEDLPAFSNKHLANLARHVTASVTSIDWDSQIKGEKGAVTIDIDTNLENIIRSSVQSFMGEQMQRLKAGLEKRIADAVKKEKHQLNLQETAFTELVDQGVGQLEAWIPELEGFTSLQG